PETQLIWGTPHYSSPERLDTGRASAQDDLWADGVMLYEMIAGHRPYSKLEPQDPDAAKVRHAILTGAEPEPLPECAPPMQAIVPKMLRRQSERRYPSAIAFRQDLDAFLRGKETVAVRERRTPAPVVVSPTGGGPVATERHTTATAGVIPPAA